MTLRPTQQSIYALVRSGLDLNMSRLARAQQQLATGKRILAPSDDANGAARVMSFQRQSASVASWISAIDTGRPQLSTASSRLQEGSTLLVDARASIIQGMNGALSSGDREAIATQLESIYDSLLDVANSRSGERYVFGGTSTDTQPFVEVNQGGRVVVEYRGDSTTQEVLVGRDVRLEVGVPGDAVFGESSYSGLWFSGLTGVQAGTSASGGTGYHQLDFRHDGTVGDPGQGVALVGGGANDTILGDHALAIKADARTVQLGDGDPVAIPDPLPASLTVTDSDGSSVVLDFTGWTGLDSNAVLTGEGSVSLNGAPHVPVDFLDDNFQLVDEASGAVLHLDMTGVSRSGEELVNYEGTSSIFDVLRGAIDDLRSGDEFTSAELHDRLESRLTEFDRNRDNLLLNLGKLGALEERLTATEERLQDIEVKLEGMRSSIEDADPTEVVLEMTRAEQTLQVAQATGARLIQQSLLNFIR